MTDSVGSTGNITGTVNPSAQTTTSTSSDNFGAGMGKDTFLKLLVAQLKYQNPLSPTDSEQYMAQMAQFTTVEKLADIQKSQTDLANWQRTVAGQGMIGKSVTATPDAGGDPVKGKVVGLRLTDAGPRLVLDNGVTVSVDAVTAVDDASSSSAGSSTGSSSSGSSSGSAAGSSSGSSSGTTGSTSGTGTTGSTGSGTTGSTGTSGSTGTGSGTGTGTGSGSGTGTGTGSGSGTTG